MKQLYFVESIVPLGDERGQGQSVDVVLEVVHDDNSNQKQVADGPEYEFLHTGPLQHPMVEDINRPLEECHYVYFEGFKFTSGKDDTLAIKRRSQNSRYRRNIIKRSNETTKNGLPVCEEFSEKATVHSYHVNVGHGNCTFVLIQEDGRHELWVIDCGEIDYLQHRNHNDSIQESLKQISDKVGQPVENLKISRLMITHWHYDHISGIQRLIKDGHIDKNTIVIANMQYGFSSGCANDLLKELSSMKSICLEPTTAMTKIDHVKILYPSKRVRRHYTVYDTRSNYDIIDKVNDSSVIYSIEVAGRRMILPGDLEQKGWDTLTLNGTCCPALQNCDFFCISHHGSINGHIDIHCKHNPSCNILSCCKTNLQSAILMGRDGAYNGIFSKTVENAYKCILYSEKDQCKNPAKGFELDWASGKPNYF